MASEISGFQWSRPGYAEVMNSAAVQSLVKGRADAVKASAESAYDAGSDPREGYVVRPMQGRLAKGYVVRTANEHAMRIELKHNNLLKGLGSIGG